MTTGDASAGVATLYNVDNMTPTTVSEEISAGKLTTLNRILGHSSMAGFTEPDIALKMA
jgi:hypothetical protein